MIELSHVTMHYRKGTPVLRDVSFKVRKGEFVVVTGPSGAGKTTLFKLLNGSEIPTRGLVLVNSVNVPRLSPKEIPAFRRRLGVVFQDFKLLENQTVFENLALALDVARESRKKIMLKVQGTLVRLGLHGAMSERVCNLSGGEQQRVAIARAIVNEPDVLLADEPTGNLDPSTTEGVLRLFHDANLDGTTVLLATHDEGLTRSLHRRVIALSGGRIARAPYRIAG